MIDQSRIAEHKNKLKKTWRLRGAQCETAAKGGPDKSFGKGAPRTAVEIPMACVWGGYEVLTKTNYENIPGVNVYRNARNP